LSDNVRIDQIKYIGKELSQMEDVESATEQTTSEERVLQGLPPSVNGWAIQTANGTV
jgi:hypothetical protein